MKKTIYKKNPLIQVIIQVKYPTILELNTGDPIRFHNEIKKLYPIYQLNIEKQEEIEIKPNDNNELVPVMKGSLPIRNHTFISLNGKNKINLTNSFISLSTLSYICWEDFFNSFEKVFSFFQSVYDVPFFERIGLRYINAFSKDSLGLSALGWNELIQPPWIGALGLKTDDSSFLNSTVDSEYRLTDNVSTLKNHAGLGLLNGNMRVFIIDSDFINISPLAADGILSKAKYLHDQALEFHKSSITSKLMNAMEPKEIDV